MFCPIKLLNRVLVTQSCINYLNVIGEKSQSMTEKWHTVRRLNRPKQHIMKLIIYPATFNATHYNISRYLINAAIYHDEQY